jgi:hypothetical protein
MTQADTTNPIDEILYHRGKLYASLNAGVLVFDIIDTTFAYEKTYNYLSTVNSTYKSLSAAGDFVVFAYGTKAAIVDLRNSPT